MQAIQREPRRVPKREHEEDAEQQSRKSEDIKWTPAKATGKDRVRVPTEEHEVIDITSPAPKIQPAVESNERPIEPDAQLTIASQVQQNVESANEHEQTYATIRLEAQESGFATSTQKLTPQLLETSLNQYLNAIGNIQHIIDEIRGIKPHQVRIATIVEHSPITVSLEGAADAVQVVKDTIVPWRRNHVEIMARLLEQKMQEEIEVNKAVILERRANAAKGRAEAEKLQAEACLQREHARKIHLENELLNLEFMRGKIQLGLDIIKHLDPNLSEIDRAAYLLRLLPELDILIYSNLETSTDFIKGTGEHTTAQEGKAMHGV